MNSQNLPLHLMVSFLAFAESKNMQEAAVKVGLSQPALTSHLQQFEKHFPQHVFAMNGRKKVLTPFGEELREVAGRRLKALGADIQDLNRKFQEPGEMRLTIAGRSEVLNRLAPKLEFAGTLVFVDSDGAQAVAGVVDRKFDLAISNHLAKASSLHAMPLFRDSFGVTAPVSWMGSSTMLNKTLLQSLAAKPYLSYKDTDSHLSALLSAHRIEEPPVFKRILADWPSLVQMIERRQGWSLVPSMYVQDSAKVKSIPISTSIVYEVSFYCLYRKEHTAMPWLKALIAELKAALH
ncbi:MAG: LysR family transcriptional regulator [Bdellovibrionaceae bacterium]|nr:LysR family transcriptional regulator [Pseudobdellovibrionaceae bacterium]